RTFLLRDPRRGGGDRHQSYGWRLRAWTGLSVGGPEDSTRCAIQCDWSERCTRPRDDRAGAPFVSQDPGGKHIEWSGLRESNPSSWLGKPEHYHYAKPA